MNTRILLSLLLIGTAPFAMARPVLAEDYTVTTQKITDQKIVFATVESKDEVAARARTGGTVVKLNVKEGDEVKAGDEIALVGDDKLALQIETLDAQISGLSAQVTKSNADLKRVQSLIGSGSVSRAELDAAKAAASSNNNALKAAESQRAVIEQQVTEGKILAPSNGRVLQVPLINGSVVMSGEVAAIIAADSYILRLQLPERHARFMKVGDKVRLDGNEMGSQNYKEGVITLVYPGIENGRVVADAAVEGLENYFIGERVRAWIATGDRQSILVPADYVTTIAGIDYVSLKNESGQVIQVPVQRGHAVDQNGTGMIDILSGLKDGDVLTKTTGE
ncbi:MAG: efflux RND transporter periplasmic adaptor subunit [Alphaproteobacteria bacterium]|nr:efflux RND transporter periplasmic adaptor subunit [Alphaproteobacteria bacterium]